MKKTIGTILIGLGFLLLIFSSVSARDAPDLSYLIGTFLPGFFFLIFGLMLRREKTLDSPLGPAGDTRQPADTQSEPQSNRFATKADLGVAIGIAIMFMSSGTVHLGPEFLQGVIAAFLAGWALMIWGSVNYTRWKGYSGWFGLFGYLLVPGLMILACLPNRRKRIYATKDHIYEVTAYVPEMRLASDDVRKFFDSFELSSEPGTAPDRGGR